MRVFRFISLLAGLGLAMTFAVTPANAQFTGCGVGVFGALGHGQVDLGPVDIGLGGQQAGLNVSCDVKMGQIVVGAGADYGWMFGDLEKFGIDHNIYLYGRAGLLVNELSLFYGHAGLTRYEGSGGHLDGYKLGVGTELKLPKTPGSLDLRYSYVTLTDEILPGRDTTGHEFRIGLSFKIGPGMFGGKGPVFEDMPVACDPKMANCKKN